MILLVIKSEEHYNETVASGSLVWRSGKGMGKEEEDQGIPLAPMCQLCIFTQQPFEIVLGLQFLFKGRKLSLRDA